MTRLILTGSCGMRKYNPLKRECKECGSKEILEIHHEIYPERSKEVKKAMDEGRIYYLCRSCHGRRNSHVI